MSDEKGKYSVTMVAKSGDRVLTRIVYPDQDYAEFLGTQYAITMGLFKGGLQKADLDGVEMPDELRAMLSGAIPSA